MATHCSVLAWRIPWTEEPGGLSPWGCKESYMTEQPTYILYLYIYIYIYTCIYNPTVQTHYTDMQITEYRQYAKSISVLKITLNFRHKYTKIIQMYWSLSLLLSYCIACLIDSWRNLKLDSVCIQQTAGESLGCPEWLSAGRSAPLGVVVDRQSLVASCAQVKLIRSIPNSGSLLTGHPDAVFCWGMMSRLSGC